MEVIGPDPIHAAETVPFDDSPQEHQVEAEPCDRIGEARGVRRSSWRRRTFALLGAFSPGLKPGRCQIKRSRGFENPLPRTESPGLAQLRRFADPNTAKMSSAGQFATPKYLETKRASPKGGPFDHCKNGYWVTVLAAGVLEAVSPVSFS